MKVALLAFYSAYPFRRELGAAPESIKRVSSSEAVAEAVASVPGVDLHVITSWKGPRTQQVSRRGLTVTYLSIGRLVNAATLWGRTRWLAARLLDEIKPDVVHGIGTEHVWPTVALDSKRPAVVTINGVMSAIVKKTDVPLWSRWQYFARLERRVFARMRNLIAPSPYVQALFADRRDVCTHYVENPLAERYHEVQAQPDRSRTIVFVGHTGQGKRLKTVLQALVLLEQEGCGRHWQVSVIGPRVAGRYDEDVQRYIAENGLGPRVHFEGFLLPDAIIQQYEHAAFLVLPSAQETAPLSIMEASAAGLPVLATRVGGVADLVDEGRTGFLCDVDDVRQLADRMRTLIVHPALRQQMGQEGKAVAATRWRPETAGRRLLDVYRQVAASG